MLDITGACPKCGSSWKGDEIAKKYKDKGYYGDKTHFSRAISIYDRDKDMTVAIRCPDCSTDFPRD